MGSALEIKFDIDGKGGAQVRRLFSRLEDPSPTLRDLGEYKRRRIVMMMPRLPRGQRSAPGGPPARRSNLFAQRMTYDVAGSKLEVGTNDERARLLQEGGTIRPKTAKALTVPVHPDAHGKRARDFSNLVLIDRKKSGKPPLLVRKTGETRFDVMFVLLKSVTIQPRPYLWWDEADKSYVLISLKRNFEEGAA